MSNQQHRSSPIHQSQIGAALVALQFLTIIPVSHSFHANNKQIGQSVLYYPIVGLLIGCLLLLSLPVINNYSFSTQAVLILILWIVITGGLHLDGLADCADAWVGGFGNRQRSLEIMKDPAAGPIAVLVLILLLLLKCSLIYSVLEKQLFSALLLTPLLGRVALLILMCTSDYIRKQGLGTIIMAHLPQSAIKKNIFLCLLITPFFLGVLPVLSIFLVVFIIRWQANKRLGGVTGDVYGSTVELAEIAVLLSAVA